MGKHNERGDKRTDAPMRVGKSDCRGSGSVVSLVRAREDQGDWLERERRERRCVEDLAACEQAYRADFVGAISDTMLCCERYDCSPPRWLVDAVIKQEDLHTTPDELDERRKRALHLERYDAVQELWERTLRGEQFDSERLRTMADVYAKVAEHFGISVWAVERSCRIVRKDTEAGQGAKYFQPLRRRF